MKRISIVFALLLITYPAHAGPIQHNLESTFLTILKSPYLFEDFNDYTYGSYRASTLTLEQNGYQAVLSASRGLYSLNGSMSTRWNTDLIVIDFTGSPIPVTAVGANIWPTDLPGNDVIGNITATLSDGTVYVAEIDAANHDTFLGFGTLGTPFLRLEIMARIDRANPSTWPTLDNLYVGTDPLPPIPEPSSIVLLTMGLCGLGVSAWAKKK